MVKEKDKKKRINVDEKNDEKKDEVKEPMEYLSYFQLFRYATSLEILAILVGIVSSGVTGACMFWLIAAYGELNTMFVERTVRREFTSTKTTFLKGAGGGVVLTNATAEEAKNALLDDCKAYGFLMIGHALVTFFSGCITIYLINWAARRQIRRIRLKFLEAILRQELSWFDTEANINFASRMTDDLEKLKEGISEKLGIFTYQVLSSIIMIVAAFVWGWQLTLACLAAVPISVAVAGGISIVQSRWAVKEQAALSKASSVAEEVLTAIRTVVAFGGEKKEVDRYKRLLEPVEKYGRARGILTGLTTGTSWMIMYAANVVGFVYGVRLVVWTWNSPDQVKVYHPGVILTITYNVLIATQNVAMSAPLTESFAGARGAAAAVFKIIERRSKIDSLSESGQVPSESEKYGEVILDDVHFNYPSRPDVRVIRGVSLHVSRGESVALVGASGCGKSTVLQLIQRCYDPILGVVHAHGMDVRTANISALRKLNGVVGQEPVLFSGTIAENIACGDECSQEEIQQAAEVANAHQFITKLPNGYDTTIGPRGSQLSGGQKQRIAIARAVIRKPALLLLDEPTSALDHHAEKHVQAALDQASRGRTTVVVSHRLSTIVNSSRILCMDAGKIVEEGSHEELMNRKGVYWKLVTSGSEIKGLEADTTESVPEDDEAEADDAEPTDRVEDDDVPREGKEKRVRRRSTRRLHRTVSFRRGSVVSRRMSGISLGSNLEYPQLEYEERSDDDDEEEDVKEKKKEINDWQLLKLSASEWPLLVTGAVAALLQGGSFPAFSILFSYVFGLFALQDPDEIFYKTDLYSGLLFLVAACAGAIMFVQTYVFTCAGAKLTTRLRVEAFTSYLKQDMSFFDCKRNAVGALCSRLGGDAGALQAATGARLGVSLLGASTLLTGFVIAVCHEYRMTLVGSVFLPLVVIGMWAEGVSARVAAERERECMEEATSVATEAVQAIRTVHSLGMERVTLQKYRSAVTQGHVAASARAKWRGAVYGFGLVGPALCYNVSLVYGGTLIAYGEMSYQTALLVVESLMNGAFLLGQALVFAPNFAAARHSAANVLHDIHHKTNVFNYRGLKDNSKTQWKSRGNLDLKNVEYRYPNRPKQAILRGLQLQVTAGSRVALVGWSGCGKSTALHLLLRLYDPDAGTIELDHRDIKRSLTLSTLRQQFGLVQQESVLFDRSIGENIAYGACGRRVNMHEIVAAARAANIHDVIVSLPQGYDTALGSGGASLSGGQKQRVCVARALLRQPRLLLLDEATSALDVASEKAVTEALNAASTGRTTIVIAHRLSTIQDCDMICVIHNGRIVECGKHKELLKKGGYYYNMYQMQNVAK